MIGPHIRAVFFDLDDTLVDSHTAFGAAVGASVSELLGRDVDQAQLLTQWRRDAGGHYGQYTRGELSYERQRQLRLEHIVGREVSAADFLVWNATFSRVFEESWYPFPDAAPTLSALARRDIALGVITNGPGELQARKLEAVGLAHIPVVVSVDTLGIGKPDPRVFEFACQDFGVDRSDAMYVGDELENDAIGAVAAGMPGVWLDRPGRRKGGAHQEDENLAKFHDIPVIATLSRLLVGE